MEKEFKYLLSDNALCIYLSIKLSAVRNSVGIAMNNNCFHSYQSVSKGKDLAKFSR